eukprot:5222793-Heterocapsa_arctica.AAC.1
MAFSSCKASKLGPPVVVSLLNRMAILSNNIWARDPMVEGNSSSQGRKSTILAVRKSSSGL